MHDTAQDMTSTRRTDDTFAAHGVTYHRVRVWPSSPAAAPVARLAILHGYGDHAGRYVDAMTWFAAHGRIDCHAVDLRGHGRSSGRRGYVSRWREYLDDVDAFLSHPALASDADESPLFVLGHSHGGLVAAAAGIDGLLARHGVAGCVLSAPYLINAFPVPRHKSAAARVMNVVCPWLRIRSGITPDMTSRDPVMIEDSRRDPLLLRCATPRWYLEQRRVKREVLGSAARFTLPLLVVQGDADPIADPRGARTFVDAAASRDKTLVEYPELRHEPLRELGRERVFSDVLAWIERRARDGADAVIGRGAAVAAGTQQ